MYRYDNIIYNVIKNIVHYHERFVNKISLLKYCDFMNKIASHNSNFYDFYDEYSRQRKRDMHTDKHC